MLQYFLATVGIGNSVGECRQGLWVLVGIDDLVSL